MHQLSDEARTDLPFTALGPGSRPVGLLPRASDALDVLASPVTYLIVVGTVAIVIAKLSVLSQIAHIGPWWHFALRVIAPDVAVFLGLAAIAVAVEPWHPILRLLVQPCVLAVFGLSVANAAYLGIAGEQLAPQSIGTGVDRLEDVASIVLATLGSAPPSIRAVAVAIIAVPFVVTRRLRRRGYITQSRAAAVGRLRAMLSAAGIAALIWASADGVVAVPVRALERNVLLTLATVPTAATDTESVTRLSASQSSDDATVVAQTLRRGSNIVILIVESLRRRSTSLVDRTGGGTPALASIAAGGMEVVGVRAAVPHTTKSLWTILCGRWPRLRPDAAEAVESTGVDCLPRLLQRAGYRTALLQSAVGTFEDRARLAANLGFGEFAAAEDLGGQSLGYLASDDQSLVAPLERLLSDDSEQPFAVVVLTSATHHPYELSDEVRRLTTAGSTAVDTPEERYAQLVESADRLVAGAMRLLRSRGRLSDTVVVVVGDHGEGFGAQGVRQHDNNYFEEGLSVPWVMAGPSVPNRTVDGDYSLLDVMPTIVEVLGVQRIPDRALAGRSVLREDAAKPVKPFVCWFNLRCIGYVQAGVKVIHEPMFDEYFAFDLATDPHERRARPLTAGEFRTLADVARSLAEQSAIPGTVRRPRVDVYPNWLCKEGEPCRHRTPRRADRAHSSERGLASRPATAGRQVSRVDEEPPR